MAPGTDPDAPHGTDGVDGVDGVDAAAAAGAARRAAQDGAAELARMGIDPRALGLEPPPAAGTGPPAAPPDPGAGSGSTVRGVAPAPPAARTPSSSPTPAPAPSWMDSTLSRPIAAVPAGAGGYAGSLAQLVPHPATRPPGRWRATVRAAALGLFEPGAAAAVAQEQQLVARVRRRRPEPRVVAFLAGKGGVGVSTTAAGVALTLASLRHDTTALVCARTGAGSLGQRLRGRPAPPVPALPDGAPAGPPPPAPDRLAVVDGAPWHTPVPAEVLLRLLERLRAEHPLTIVDVGNELGEPADGVLTRADQIVLVTGASLDAVAATRTALSRVHQVDPFRLATVVVAVVCLSERQHRRTARRLRTELGMRPDRIVPVGFDPWLAAGDRIDPARLRAATREAYLRIAGLVVEPGGGGQWFSPPPATGPGARA